MPKIAIIQEKPVAGSLAKCLEIAVRCIEAAAQAGARIIVFGECWFTGYPAWIDHCLDLGLWEHEPVKEVWAELYANGLEIPGPEVEQLCGLAARHQVVLVMGANEVIRRGRGNGSLYNTALIIDAAGRIANHHRKLMPTYTERMIHGLGDGQGLQSVPTEYGDIGALICWEHWMPLARQAMHDAGEQIHVALWPAVKENNILASRHYALEGRCYVLAVGQLYQVQDLPERLSYPNGLKDDPDRYLLDGGSAVIGPDGRFLLTPQYEKAGILYAELPDLQALDKEKMNLAVSGHYQRYDVFALNIDRKRKFG